MVRQHSAESVHMRYFFHLSDGTFIEDDAGEVCSTVEEAKRFAMSVAAELGQNRDAKDFEGGYVCVTDEGGTEVFRTPLVNLKRTVKADNLLEENGQRRRM
jgi:hypothetical protein